MNFSTDQIIAFLEVSRRGSFSRAAEALGLTQAALSIRIKKLEENLERSLLIRGNGGLSMTEAGKEFLVFAETYEALQQEYLGNRGEPGKLSGNLRIGSYSTIGRSLVLPALLPLLQQHPAVRFNFMVREVRELWPLLQSGEADFILLDHELPREGLVQELLGFEEYVLVTGKKGKSPEVYLNHDENDLTSYSYYEALGQKKERLERRYLDEIYSVLDGVAAGIGVSVLPLHLAREDKRIAIPHPNRQLRVPVFLCYKQRSYYTRLFEAARSALSSSLRARLRQK